MIREYFKKCFGTKGYYADLVLDESAARLIAPAKTFDDDCFTEIFTSKSSTELKGGEKLYFIPNCILPRFKLNKLKQADFISVVKNIQSADVVVYNENAISKLISKGREYIIQCKNYTQPLQDKIDSEREEGNKSLGNLENTRDMTIKHSEDFIDVNYWILTYDEHKNKPVISSAFWSIKESQIELLEFIITTDKPFIQDKDLQKYITNSVALDRKSYDELNEMLASSDNNNQVLAIELMANCDYETSLVYLLFLIKNNSQTIRNRKESSHVNFKSLLEYINYDHNWYYTNIDSVIEILSNHKQLNKENMEIVLSLGMSDDSISTNTGTDYFVADAIVPSEDLMKAMEKGFLDKPEQEDEEEEEEDDDDTNEDFPF